MTTFATPLRLFQTFDPDIVQAMPDGTEGSSDEMIIRNVVVATDCLNRNGWRTIPEGISFANYAKNPVILWGHDARDPENVLGHASVRLENGRVIADLTFDSSNAKAVSIYEKLRNRTIKAFSIGTQPTRVHYDDNDDLVIDACDLVEISVCAIGADPDALLAASLDNFRTEFNLTSKIEDLTGKIEDLSEQVDTLKASLASTQADLDKANALVSTLQAREKAGKVEALLARGKAEGKVLPAMITSLQKAGMADPAWLEEHIQCLPVVQALTQDTAKAQVMGMGTLAASSTGYHGKAYADMSNVERERLARENKDLFDVLRASFVASK